MTSAGELKEHLKNIVKQYSEDIQKCKADLLDNDLTPYQKFSNQRYIGHMRNILDHIKNGKIIIDLVDVEGRYYISTDMLNILYQMIYRAQQLSNKLIMIKGACFGQWDILYNIHNEISAESLQGYNSDYTYISIHGLIQKYRIFNGDIQSYPPLDDYYRRIYPHQNQDNERNRIIALDKMFEFNTIQYENDFTILQNNITTSNTNLELRLGAITQEFQSKLEAMAQEMNKVSKTATDRIRDLEMEVHYLKSITECKVKVDYESIKQKNKALNAEFKRIYKLYRR